MFEWRNSFKIVIEITAAGIVAATVIPTLSPKYAFAADIMTVRIILRTKDLTVISGKFFDAEMYGTIFIESNLFCGLDTLNPSQAVI